MSPTSDTNVRFAEPWEAVPNGNGDLHIVTATMVPIAEDSFLLDRACKCVNALAGVDRPENVANALSWAEAIVEANKDPGMDMNSFLSVVDGLTHAIASLYKAMK